MLLPFLLGPVTISSFTDEYALSGKCYRGTKVKFEDEEVDKYFLLNCLLQFSIIQLLINSRQVFMGYLLDGPGTASAITDSCWFKTGVSVHKKLFVRTHNNAHSI